MQAIKRAFRRGMIVHLLSGADADVETLVAAIANDRAQQLVRVKCEDDTTPADLPDAHMPDDTLVYYANFGDLPSEIQVTAAQRIKSQFEYGMPVIVQSSETARGDLTLRNGDLVGRVRAIEVSDSVVAEVDRQASSYMAP